MIPIPIETNVPSYEVALRAFLAFISVLTVVTLVFGLAMRYLRPRPLFTYMAVAITAFTAVRVIILWMAFLPEEEADAYLVWLAPLHAATGCVVILSVLLMALYRIREGRLISKATNIVVVDQSGTVGKSR